MTDIVERLRKLADRERPYGSLPDTLDEAANEIEHLRLALEVAANDLDDWGAYTKAKNARAALEGE